MLFECPAQNACSKPEGRRYSGDYKRWPLGPRRGSVSMEICNTQKHNAQC